MKVTPPKQKNTKRFIQPVIPLERPEKKSLKKDDVLAFKLRSTPADPASMTYELTIPYFCSGTPEELLKFLELVDRAILGTNTVNGPDKYALIRRLLQGDPLSAFNNAANARGVENNDNYDACCQDLIRHIFPRCALSKQKRWMRRFLRKPSWITTREFMSRMTELNELLDRFPNFDPDQRLPEDEIMDIAEFGVPNKWQKQMVLQGFDTVNHTPNEFVEFCERLEATEDDQKESPKQESFKKDKKGTKRKLFDEYYCMKCKKNPHHNTEDCRILKNMVKNEGNPHKRFKNKTWKRDQDNKSYDKNKFKNMEHLMSTAIKEAAAKHVKEHFSMNKMDPPTENDETNDDILSEFNECNINEKGSDSDSSSSSSEDDE